MLLIKNGLINDAVNREAYVSDILTDNGKIIEIAENIENKDAEIIDAKGLFVYPGFVEAHCHLGLHGYGIGFEGADYNEMNDILSPQLRAIDSIYPQDETFAKAVKGGVTCVCTGPGSANVLGGTFTAIKTVGNCVDNMIVKKETAMKCAFGENPKRCYKDKNNFARMSTASKLREILMKAKDYKARIEAAEGNAAKKPAFDMKLESLQPVINKEIPLKAHAHRADDIFTAIRIAKEFDVDLTIEHCTEGHLIAEEIAKYDYPLAVGPTLTNASKYELRNKSWETPKILAEAGCRVSIITDSPVIPQEYLATCAGFAVKAGMDSFDALQAITINPAKHIGIEDRVGSIEAGKDADIIITNADPITSTTCDVLYTIIDGKVVYKA